MGTFLVSIGYVPIPTRRQSSNDMESIEKRSCHKRRYGMEDKMKERELVMPTEVYSRVVGYYRPVQNWNVGKRQEFSERETFDKALSTSH